jgi:hypothetical protein
MQPLHIPELSRGSFLLQICNFLPVCFNMGSCAENCSGLQSETADSRVGCEQANRGCGVVVLYLSKSKAVAVVLYSIYLKDLHLDALVLFKI